VFHTKTIESILDPVAQQVSRLVIIHEEGEAGHEMPDLERPVQAVSKAVANLAKVGREMANTTDDSILRQDMPIALTKVENAATLLEDASNLSKFDPNSKTARTKLIEGSRWILQGTSGVLLCFDESEVRKIIKECKKVLDYLSVAEVIESMEDLVQFVKDLSPCLSKVTREVEKRVEDLTHQVHREILSRCVDQVKTLAPILICSMKIFVQIVSQRGRGGEEAAENRNYLACRMTDEVGEIIRVLQLVTYDEEDWSSDNIQVMKKTIANIDSKMQPAMDWLRDPEAVQGGMGEKSLRNILDMTQKVAERSLPIDADHLRRLAGDVSAMTDSLCELRMGGRGATPQSENLARNIQSRLGEVAASVNQATSRLEKSGIQQPAPTIVGRLEQSRRWLEQPGVDDRGVGSAALQLIVDEARKVADGLPGNKQSEISGLCTKIEAEQARLIEAVRRGEANSPQAVSLAKSLSNKVAALADCIQSALVDRVVEDFVDILTPLKQFSDCILTPGDPANREQVFSGRRGQLENFSGRVANTAKLVATGNSSGNRKIAEALLSSAEQVESLTPQLVNAGMIRMVYPENKAADEHFENLRKQFAETVLLTRTLADEATDSGKFVGQSLVAMQHHTAGCDEAIVTRQPARMVENTSSIARLANRVLQLTKQEADNSEDLKYVSVLNVAAGQLQTKVSPMVQCAKSVAMKIDDQGAIDAWRRQNGLLLEAVQSVHKAVQSNNREDPELQQPPIPPYPDVSSLRIDEVNDMGSVSHSAQYSSQKQQHSFSSSIDSQKPKKHVFSDDELSEIFQIDFGQIFGNPDSGRCNNYRSKQSSKAQSNISSSLSSPPLSPLPPPLEFQSSPKVAPKVSRSKSDAAVPARQAVSKSKSAAAMTMTAHNNNFSQNVSQSFTSEEKAVSQFSRSITNSSSSFSQNMTQDSKSFNGSNSRMAIAGDGRLAGSTAAEADLFLEELMEEAKKDPSFGVVPGMTKPNEAIEIKSDKKERGAVERFNYIENNNNNESRPGSSAGGAPDNYPFVPRPYRTAQDMIIRDKSSDRERSREPTRMAHGKHDMPKRPFRTATDFKIEDSSNRSRSADGRLFKPFSDQDPRLNNFKRTNSTENFTGEMMQEVVTDQRHTSVKDLVAKLETSTKSESENPYIRKWGCDLISPEPRRKGSTYRFQRKQMPDPEFAHKLQYSMSDYGTGSRTHSRNRNLSGTSHDSQEPFLDTYTTDIEDLVDRQHGEQDIDLVFQDLTETPNEANNNNNSVYSTKPEDNRQNNSVTAVEWPPRTESESQVLQSRQDNYAQQSYSHTNSVNTTNQMNNSIIQQQQSSFSVFNKEADVQSAKKKKVKKSQNHDVLLMNKRNTQDTAMTNGSSKKYDRNSLIELDAQIMNIQSQFESELEGLIDMYKNIQNGNKNHVGVNEDLSTLRSNNSTIRETAELLWQELSDDEGTYQAHDIVFDKHCSKDGTAPPRPPPPSGNYGGYQPPRPPPPPDTDDEADNMFEHAPTPSQGPIMMAAHDLHQEVKQWSSKDNDIIAAAKKMALLMAKLSQLVEEDSGSKKELISIAKAIAESSDEVTRLAKELAMECTDKRMRTNLLSVCERIPTIGTQLKILSTVKATMLGAQGTEEDIEATEMLVGNAQNLMQSVKQTVTAAEAASIKIRTEAGIKLKWVRKQPWYQY